MHQFLKEEEQLQLQLLEMEERENLKKLRDNEIKLTQQMRSLSKVIGQIESTCQNSIVESFEVRISGKLMGGKKPTFSHLSYFKSYKINFYLPKKLSSGPKKIFLRTEQSIKS